MAIFQFLLTSVMPVAAALILGLFMGRRQVFVMSDAITLSRLIAFVGVPAITINIFTTVDLQRIDWTLFALYASSEAAIYAMGACAARFLFRMNWIESIIVGMACSFSNHVLFVYPIALLSMPVSQVIPVEATIIWGVVSLSISITLIELCTPGRSLPQAAVAQLRNPAMIGCVVGFVLGQSFETVPAIITNMAGFFTKMAAPCALFATGVILSQNLRLHNLSLALTITAYKSVFHPALAFIIIMFWGGYNLEEGRSTLMVSFAPLGVMAVTFGMRYGVDTGPICLAMLISFMVALLGIPIVATW